MRYISVWVSDEMNLNVMNLEAFCVSLIPRVIFYSVIHPKLEALRCRGFDLAPCLLINPESLCNMSGIIATLQ